MKMRRVYAVDIPTPDVMQGGTWHHVADFPTLEEAVAFIRDKICPCTDAGAVNLISELEIIEHDQDTSA